MKSRNKFFLGGTLILIVIAAISVQELQEKTVFFYTPKEILANPKKFKKKTIRIGGLVQKRSVEWDAKNIQLSFNITEDNKIFIPVFYDGIKPDLFREGQGVVVEGKLEETRFEANQLLVKHSEEYSLNDEKKQNKEDYYKSIQLK